MRRPGPQHVRAKRFGDRHRFGGHVQAPGDLIPDLEVRALDRHPSAPEDPPGPYAVTGVRFYDAGVFDVLPWLERSARGLIEINRLDEHLLATDVVEHDVVDGYWCAAASSMDAYLEASDLVRRNGAGT